MVILKGSRLTKIYGNGEGAVNAVKDVNISIEKADLAGIIGKSGGGKTTLLKMLGSMLQPTEGEIVFDNASMKNLKPDELAEIRRKKMGFLFQDFKLLNSLNVKENIALPMLLDKTDIDAVSQRVNELLQILDIEEISGKKIDEISGGQCQRVALCRALANNPAVLFADEPTGNLDTVSTKSVMNCLKKINDLYGITVVLVTHDYKIASQCHKLFVMKDGCIDRVLNRDEYTEEEFEKEVIHAMDYL